MKKTCILLLLCMLLSSSILPISAKEDTLQDDGSYHIVSIEADGSYTILEDVDTYAQAKVRYTLRKPSYDNLAITYGTSFLSVEQGVVAFESGKSCELNITYTNDENGEEGYTNACYGIDAAFLEYNPSTQKVKFRLSGVNGWADAMDVTIYPIEQVKSISSFTVKNGILYHHIASSLFTDAYDNVITLGTAPSDLQENVTYYSYDTHYFYDSYANMADDYRKNTHVRACNANTPYYNYYQYMHHRSTSSYTLQDIDNYLKQALGLTHTIRGFYDKDNYIHDILTQSLLLQGEDAFFQYQNQFGTNAVMMLSLALNESALGRSYLSFTRNNLFGHAAYDSAVEEHASRYASVGASVYSHALHYLSNAYMDPEQFSFHGGFFGNKAGGMNVSYASDPYWGEKAAQYFYEIDHALGDKDKNRYALGIVKNSKVSVYKNADEKSDVIYSFAKGYDAACILLEKIENKDGSWYRIQTDPMLDAKQEPVSGSYDFKTSYGFIRAKDLTAILNSSHIQELSYVDLRFDANGGSFYPHENTITLHTEVGHMPIIQAPVKEHALFDSWDIALEPAKRALTYKALYKDVRQIVITQKPLTEYGIHDSLDVSEGMLRVEFSDGTSKDVAMTCDMISGFSSDKKGTKTVTVTYAGCTIPYDIHVSDTLQEKQENMQQRASAIIKLYDGKTNLSKEAIQELEQFKEDVSSFSVTPLLREQIRTIDRILQENLDPRYSVIIKDDHYDLQVSGLSMARKGDTNFLHIMLPKTIVLKVSDSIEQDKEQLGKKIAKASGVRVDGSFSISGKDDFSSLKLQQEMVFSIKKPKNSTNRRYQVYYIDEADVYQIPTTQSKHRICFTTEKLGSYMLVSYAQQGIQEEADIFEVNMIANNGKNYIMRYIVLPCFFILLLLTALLAIRLCHRRHVHAKTRRHAKKKKQHSRHKGR